MFDRWVRSYVWEKGRSCLESWPFRGTICKSSFGKPLPLVKLSLMLCGGLRFWSFTEKFYSVDWTLWISFWESFLCQLVHYFVFLVRRWGKTWITCFIVVRLWGFWLATLDLNLDLLVELSSFQGKVVLGEDFVLWFLDLNFDGYLKEILSVVRRMLLFDWV